MQCTSISPVTNPLIHSMRAPRAVLPRVQIGSKLCTTRLVRCLHAPGASGEERASHLADCRDESKYAPGSRSKDRCLREAGGKGGKGGSLSRGNQLVGVGFFGQNRSVGNLIHDKRDRPCVRLEWSASANDHVCVQFLKRASPPPPPTLPSARPTMLSLP